MKILFGANRLGRESIMELNAKVFVCTIAAFIVVLALDSAQPVACDYFALPSALTQLKGKSYSLMTRLRKYPSAPVSMEVEEFYSAWQQRSRINYKMRGYLDGSIPWMGTIIASEQQVLLTAASSPESERENCTRLTHDAAQRMFSTDTLSELEQDAPRHLIGPSRLLHFISDIISDLDATEQDSGPDTTDDSLKRGRYKMKFVYSRPNGPKLEIFYGQDQADNLAHGVPHEIHLHLGAQSTVYEFKQVILLPQSQFIDRRLGSGAEQFLAQGHVHSELAHDLFSWSRVSGCSEVIQKNQHDDKLDLVGLSRRTYRFSFSAKPRKTGLVNPFELVVGYEPSLSTLRVNRISATRISETTMNYLQMRRYHVNRRRNKSPDSLMDRLNALRLHVANSENQSPAEDEQVSCVMTRAIEITTQDPLSRGYKLGQILLGSDKFTYLGRAKVRGIDALMFESPNADWPVWFESPSLYYRTERPLGPVVNQVFNRPSAGFVPANQFAVNIVIYLTATTVGAQEERPRCKSDYEDVISLEDRLLMMEIYEIHSKSKQVLQKVELPIYDFTWHITPGGIDTKRFVDFFAIADSCPSEANENKQHARMDLVLKIEPTDESTSSVSKFDANSDSSENNWLLSDTKRNLAILKAIHTYVGLPTTMIYDMESRFEPRPTGNETFGARLLVSFQAADHVRHLNELIYLGNGNLKRGKKGKFERFGTTNFFTCHMLAAHFKVDTVFAFDSSKRHCYIYAGRSAGPSLVLLISSVFEMEAKDSGVVGALEVYQVSRTPAIDRRMGPIKRSSLKVRSLSSMRLTQVLDDGRDDWPASSTSSFTATISSFRTTLGEASLSGDSATSLVSVGGVRLAVGLVASNAMNTLVSSASNDETDAKQVSSWLRAHLRNSLGEMTFGQCQAQCLASSECRAFSVCIRGGRIECVLTRADFRSKQLLEQLKQVASSSAAKMGETFSLKATTVIDGDQKDEEFVEIRKHPTCELHNKDYMALAYKRYAAQVRWAQNLARLKPVRDRQECAERCFQQTMKTLRELVEPLRLGHKQTLDGHTVRRLYHEHRAAAKFMCSSFLYLDPEHNEVNLVKRLHELHKREEAANQEDWNGFCSITGAEDKSADSEPVNFETSPEIYQVDFGFMYDKHFGISLAESSQTADEESAFEAATRARDDESEPISDDQIQALKTFTERGDNKVELYPSSDPSECAKMCFLQSRQALWPACKSFSVIKKLESDNKKASFCQLNSVTLRDTLERERFDLIKSENDSTGSTNGSRVIHWHYEPKPDLIGRFVDWTAQLQADHDYWGPAREPLGQSSASLEPIWLLACALTSLMLGAAMGVSMGKKFILRLDTIREDTEDLVSGMVEASSSSHVPIEFRNLATCYEEPEKEAEEQESANR